MKALKSSVLKGKNLIGIDETNNGSNDFPLLICGYLMMIYPGNHNGISEYEYKRSKAFNPETSFEKVKKMSNYYLERHPDFYYATISNEDVVNNFTWKAFTHARAFSSIILKFVQTKKLSLEDTFVAVHYVGAREFNARVLQDTSKLLDSMEVRIPIFASKKALGKYVPVKKAHWVGHYLAALKIRGNMKGWPHEGRHTSLDASHTYLKYCREKQLEELRV